MSATEPPLRDVMAAIFARAALSGEAASITLSRGLHLRAAPTPAGAMRRLLIWRDAPGSPATMNEARICADAAGFMAYDAEWTAGEKAILISERKTNEKEVDEAGRYQRGPALTGPWIPGRELPPSGALELNRLYHLKRPEGVYYLMIRASGPLQVHGAKSVDVERSHAAQWLNEHGYTQARITAGGYLL